MRVNIGSLDHPLPPPTNHQRGKNKLDKVLAPEEEQKVKEENPKRNETQKTPNLYWNTAEFHQNGLARTDSRKKKEKERWKNLLKKPDKCINIRSRREQRKIDYRSVPETRKSQLKPKWWMFLFTFRWKKWKFQRTFTTDKKAEGRSRSRSGKKKKKEIKKWVRPKNSHSYT